LSKRRSEEGTAMTATNPRDGKEKRLGRGLDAIIPRAEGEPQERAEASEAGEREMSSIDEAALEAAVRDAEHNPRLTLWSKESAAVLRYLRKTTPEFSISKEAAKALEEALKNKYYDVWKAVKERLGRGT